MTRLERRRDFYAGLLMLLIGLGAILEARHYSLGTLRQMGPGYFPIVIGVLIGFVGLLIVGSALIGRGGGDTLAAVAGGEPVPDHEAAASAPDLRGGLCILGGMAAFIVLGRYAGLVPATFAAVFISAIGDRDSTLRGALILAVSVTVAAVVLFSYLLKVQFPLFGGQ